MTLEAIRANRADPAPRPGSEGGSRLNAREGRDLRRNSGNGHNSEPSSRDGDGGQAAPSRFPLAALLKTRKRALAWLLAGSLASALTFGVALPILILKITDEGVTKGDLRALLFYTLVALLAFSFNGLAVYLIRVKRTRLRNSLVEEISRKMLGDFYRIPYQKTLGRDSGYFVARICDETPKAVEPLVRLIIELAVTALSMSASLAVVAYLSWRVAVLVLVGILFFQALSRRLTSKIRETSKGASESEALSKGIVERLIGAHRIVNVFEMDEQAGSKYSLALRRQLTRHFDNARFSAAFSSLGVTFLYCSAIVVLSMAGYEVVQGRLSFGGLLAITNIYGRLVGYAQTIVDLMPSLQNARATLERLLEFESLAAERPQQPAVEGRIAVERMGFAYNSEEVCRDLSLSIQKGEKVLVIGRNGSGKSTLAHVLAGLLHPTSGTARVPGPGRVSVAFFPPSFIPGDVSENVGLERLNDPKRQLFYKIAHDFGIHNEIGQDPQQLSAGQRQKVSILRALLKDADLYIFDEPFSNVDAESKDRLFQTILRVTEGKSLVLVMHCDEQFHSQFDKVLNLELTGPQGPQDMSAHQT